MSNHLNFAPILKRHRLISGLASLALLVFAGITNAATAHTFQSAGGTWSNYAYDPGAAPYATSDGNVTGLYTNILSWGDALDGYKESLIFQGNSTETTVTPDTTAFAIGWLTHGNNAIAGDTNITGAFLNLKLMLDGSEVNLNYKFDIFQSPSTYADTLTFSSSDISTQFSLGGQSYSFNLLGFYDQGSIMSGITVLDGATEQKLLYASITTVPTTPVPTPAALWLLGSGLIGLAGFAKRKHTHQ